MAEDAMNDTIHETNTQNGEIENELQSCQEQLKQAEERCMYLRADFENFRRNTARERSVWAKNAQARIFEDLIVIADDFERAFADLREAPDLQESEQARLQGFDLMYKALIKILDQNEVVAIEAVGQFDPQKHEALVQVESPDHASGMIVEVLQKGYMFKDSVLRPAKVSVAK